MEIREVELGKIVPSKDNPRTVRDDAALQELAASVKAQGVLEPGIARPLDGGLVELCAGARRFRACQLAGLATMPLIIREMTAIEALEITVTENLHREDLHPIEESRGIQTMLSRGWTMEDAAAQLGKTRQWVARRARLSALVDPWITWAEDPEHPVGRWPVAGLEIVARFPQESQQRLAKALEKWGQGAPSTVARIRRFCAQELALLCEAPWPLDDPDLGDEPCTGCVRRSDAQPELFDLDDYQPPEHGEEGTCVQCGVVESFDDDDDEAGIEWANNNNSLCKPCWEAMLTKRVDALAMCLDLACWEGKRSEWIKRLAARLAIETGGDYLLVHTESKAPEAFGAAAPRWDTRKAEPDEPGAVRALIIDGPEAGQFEWRIDVREQSASDEAEAVSEISHENTRRARLEWLRDEVDKRLLAIVSAEVLFDGTPIEEITSEEALALVMTVGTGTGKNVWAEGQDVLWDRYRENLDEKNFNEMLDYVFAEALWTLLARVRSLNYWRARDWMEREQEQVCEVARLDWQALVAEADARWPARVEESDEGDEGDRGDEGDEGDSSTPSWEPMAATEMTLVDSKKVKVALYIAQTADGTWRRGYDLKIKGTKTGCGGASAWPREGGDAFDSEPLAVAAGVDHALDYFNKARKSHASLALWRDLDVIREWWADYAQQHEVCLACAKPLPGPSRSGAICDEC